jgi:hypothetical protein
VADNSAQATQLLGWAGVDNPLSWPPSPLRLTSISTASRLPATEAAAAYAGEHRCRHHHHRADNPQSGGGSVPMAAKIVDDADQPPHGLAANAAANNSNCC